MSAAVGGGRKAESAITTCSDRRRRRRGRRGIVLAGWPGGRSGSSVGSPVGTAGERAAEEARAPQAEAPGVSAPRVTPMRTPSTISGPGPASSTNGGSSSGKPSCPPVTPSRLAKAARSRAQAAHVVGAAPRPHHSEAGRRLEGADQHGAAQRPGAAHQVQAPMKAASVDVGVPRRAEHRGVARRRAAYLCEPDRQGRRPRSRRSRRRRRRRAAGRRSGHAPPRRRRERRTPAAGRPEEHRPHASLGATPAPSVAPSARASRSAWSATMVLSR